ncbi:MAG TPA: M14 family metallopeptidase, partial [Candidatus Krumholzibacterium sp.]|nr:M14 family metallopeptidase [Candidatus Krumholzibacterium sp.]
LATLSMHSTEVGPSQSAPLIAYDLATSADPEVNAWLDDVVYMMVPCHNPDGMDMVVEHHRKYKGTKYEGSRMPGIYHKYVGHDNNRDFVALTQSDTRAISRITSLDWFPQVMVEKHQMGSSGVRYFVPPNHDPIAENIDARLWNWIGIFGSNMMKDMTEAGLAGIAQHYLFDEYWPGSTGTCGWKNVITFLTEAASVQGAKPIYIEPSELSVHGKGLSEYKKSINMPLPWDGGWWRLSDIIDYEIGSTMSVIKTASTHKADILRLRNELCRSEIRKGQTEPPYYFIIPSGRERQTDLSEMNGIVELLTEHGIKVCEAGSSMVTSDGLIVEEGDIVVPMAQPFRSFAKEVMERQEFPLRHYSPDGEMIRPYDITSWSLPLHRGVISRQVDKREPGLEAVLVELERPRRVSSVGAEKPHVAVLDPRDNANYMTAFRLIREGFDVRRSGETITVGNADMPAGSFVVFAGSRGKDLAGSLEGARGNFVTAGEGEEGIPEKDGLVSLSLPRIAVVETYYHDMDAGWTRYLLDFYGLPFETIRPHEIEERDIEDDFDLMIFPDNDVSILVDGKYKGERGYYSSSMPPGYDRGMGKKGKGRLVRFIDGGGTVLAWGRSCELFTGELSLGKNEDDAEEFTLPFRDISDELVKEGLYCPGSLLRLRLAAGHPLTYGMPEEAGVFTRGRPVFRTSVPSMDMDRRVIATYPEKDLLLSGFGEKLETAGGKAAMVWMRKNKGQLIVYGFNPQFRASTPGTYKLLFNAVLLASP